MIFPSWILRRRKQQILIKLDIDLEYSPHLKVGDSGVGKWNGPNWTEPNRTKSSIKFLSIYYECIRACVCVYLCSLLGIDAIEDEIYADKCKVALTNVLESILASWYPACLIHTQRECLTESEREKKMEEIG